MALAILKITSIIVVVLMLVKMLLTETLMILMIMITTIITTITVIMIINNDNKYSVSDTSLIIATHESDKINKCFRSWQAHTGGQTNVLCVFRHNE